LNRRPGVHPSVHPTSKLKKATSQLSLEKKINIVSFFVNFSAQSDSTGCFFRSTVDPPFFMKIAKKIRRFSFFEQWKFCCSKSNFCAEMNFLIHLDNETCDYNVSIDFYDHQIDSIIGPTMKAFDVEDKTNIPNYLKLFILHTKYFHCGRHCAINFKLMKLEWNKMISCSILAWY